MKQERGFTLVELMVTVSVIAILAAIAIPQYARYREEAFDASAKRNMQDMVLYEEGVVIEFGYYTTELDKYTRAAQSKNVSIIVDNANQIWWSGRTWHKIGTQTYCYSNQFSNQNSIRSLEGTAQSCS